MGLKKIAISGVKWTTVSTIGRSLFQLLQVSILTRYLPKEAFGLIAMALFVIQFSNIFIDLGFSSAIFHRQKATTKEYSSIYWLNIFISVALYSILFLTKSIIAHFYSEQELIKIIPILGTNLIIMALGRQHRTIMQKEFKFKSITIIELISFSLALFSAIYFAMLDFGVYSLVYSTLFASIISNSFFLFKNIQSNPILFHFSFFETKPFLKIGAYTMGSSFLNFFSREIDILIIGKVLGAEKLGLYSLAKQIILKIYRVVNPIVLNVLNPLLATIQNDIEKIKQSYLKIIKYLTFINFPIYLIITLASKEILFLVYGAEYVESYLVLCYLAFAYFINSLGNPIDSLLIATGRTDIGFRWTIVRVLIAPIIIYIGAQNSIDAVALFTALLAVFLIIPSWYLMLKPLANIKLNEYTNQFFLTFIYYSISAFLFVFFESYLNLTGIQILDAILKSSIFLGIYILYIWIFDKKSLIQFLDIFKLAIKREN